MRIIWFDYAIIRVVPRVEREEFLNVGAIVFCRRTTRRVFELVHSTIKRAARVG